MNGLFTAENAVKALLQTNQPDYAILSNMAKKEVNKKVVIQSVIALICVVLMFLVSWWFIVPAGILLWMNQRELFKEKV